MDWDDRLVGSLALVLECPRVGNVDWFVLDAGLRGRGLGRRLLSDLVADARSRRMEKLKVETFRRLAVGGPALSRCGLLGRMAARDGLARRTCNASALHAETGAR